MPEVSPAPDGPIEAVLVDWAGTITMPMRDMAVAAAKELELSDDDMMTVFASLAEYLGDDDSVFHQAERGEIDDDDLRDALDERVAGAGAMFDVSGPFFNGPDQPVMIDLLEQLSGEDVFVVLATNNFRSAHDLLARRYLESGLVQAVANSAMMGVRKPDAAYFDLCLEAAGTTANRALFVDDQPKNVDAARALGMPTLLVGDDPALAVSAVRAALGLAST